MSLAPELTEFTTASPAIISYNYTDIIDGAGVIIFKAFSTNESGTEDYHISASSIKSNTQYTATLINSSTFSTAANLDFDTSPFNSARTVKGTAYFIIPLGYVQGGSSAGIMRCTITINHFDGTTETSIGSAISEEADLDTSTDNHISKKVIVKVVLTERLFAEGDILRVNILAEGKYEIHTTGTGYYCLGHDPAGRITQETTNINPFEDYDDPVMEMHIPFKIDI